MYNIEYEIDLNESGRPCIELPENYEHRPEDKFFAIEIARYVIQEVYARRRTELDESTGEVIETAISFLGQLGDEMAEILHGQMKLMGEIALMTNLAYHIMVDSIDERDKLPFEYFAFNGKLFKREIGLKVSLVRYNEETFEPIYEVYELVDGITNEHWKKL